MKDRAVFGGRATPMQVTPAGGYFMKGMAMKYITLPYKKDIKITYWNKRKRGAIWKPVCWVRLQEGEIDVDPLDPNNTNYLSQILINEKTQKMVILNYDGELVGTGTLSKATEGDPAYELE